MFWHFRRKNFQFLLSFCNRKQFVLRSMKHRSNWHGKTSLLLLNLSSFRPKEKQVKLFSINYEINFSSPLLLLFPLRNFVMEKNLRALKAFPCSHSCLTSRPSILSNDKLSFPSETAQNLLNYIAEWWTNSSVIAKMKNMCWLASAGFDQTSCIIYVAALFSFSSAT